MAAIWGEGGGGTFSAKRKDGTTEDTMSSNDHFEPDFWTITGASPALEAPLIQTLPQGERKWQMRPRQPTFIGVPKRRRVTSLWRMVPQMEAELLGAGCHYTQS